MYPFIRTKCQMIDNSHPFSYTSTVMCWGSKQTISVIDGLVQFKSSARSRLEDLILLNSYDFQYY